MEEALADGPLTAECRAPNKKRSHDLASATLESFSIDKLQPRPTKRLSHPRSNLRYSLFRILGQHGDRASEPAMIDVKRLLSNGVGKMGCMIVATLLAKARLLHVGGLASFTYGNDKSLFHVAEPRISQTHMPGHACQPPGMRLRSCAPMQVSSGRCPSG